MRWWCSLKAEGVWTTAEALCAKREALLDCLQTLRERHRVPWARTGVEIAIEVEPRVHHAPQLHATSSQHFAFQLRGSLYCCGCESFQSPPLCPIAIVLTGHPLLQLCDCVEIIPRGNVDSSWAWLAQQHPCFNSSTVQYHRGPASSLASDTSTYKSYR